MKKQISFILLVFLGVFIFIPDTYAAEDTFYLNIKSPRYNSSDTSGIYDHTGYHWSKEGDVWTSTRRTITYHDVYTREYYKISYYGVLGTPQMTFYRDYSVVYQGLKVKLTDIGFLMSEEMIHTNSFSVGITVSVNDISNTFGVTWTNVYRYNNNVRIMSELGNNIDEDPFVIMPVYKIEAKVIQAIHTGVSTRSTIFGEWSSYSWSTNITGSQNITLGYVGFYYYLGSDNAEYKSPYYLYNNSDEFTYPDYRCY